MPEGVEVGFTKSGADGINHPCQRAGNGGLQWVRFISKSGWVDTRANHIAEQDESRQYSAFLVVNDHEGGPSVHVRASFGQAANLSERAGRAGDAMAACCFGVSVASPNFLC